MSGIIITTTIAEPTEAVLKFSAMRNWDMVVVADTKTPVDVYREKGIPVLAVEEQEKRWPELSDCIGWNTILRRNFGFLHAWEAGYDFIATIDDDNIPLATWESQEIYVGRQVVLDTYTSCDRILDPYFIAFSEIPCFWHRGFPVELLHSRATATTNIGVTSRNVRVQTGLVNGEPDIDAVCRISHGGACNVESMITKPFCADVMIPFNSQNTILSREVLPYYFMFPGVGRFQDILASYVLQEEFGACVCVTPANVRQHRNAHSLSDDLESELFQYRYALKIVENPGCWQQLLSDNDRRCYDKYQSLFK